ncbi:MAG: hypothetical protein V1717_03690 [Candidatus Micrarchaeota archaeon]
MRKSQFFSVDFLIAAGVLAMALGVFLNSYSQVQSASVSTVNSSAFVLAEEHCGRISQLASVSGCVFDGTWTWTCDYCAGGSNKFFVQRLCSENGQARLLKVGVCNP